MGKLVNFVLQLTVCSLAGCVGELSPDSLRGEWGFLWHYDIAGFQRVIRIEADSILVEPLTRGKVAYELSGDSLRIEHTEYVRVEFSANTLVFDSRTGIFGLPSGVSKAIRLSARVDSSLQLQYIGLSTGSSWWGDIPGADVDVHISSDGTYLFARGGDFADREVYRAHGPGVSKVWKQVETLAGSLDLVRLPSCADYIDDLPVALIIGFNGTERVFDGTISGWPGLYYLMGELLQSTRTLQLSKSEPHVFRSREILMNSLLHGSNCYES